MSLFRLKSIGLLFLVPFLLVVQAQAFPGPDSAGYELAAASGEARDDSDGSFMQTAGDDAHPAGLLQPEEMRTILECLISTGENESWLANIMFYGPAGCFRLSDPAPIWAGPESIEEATGGIPFYRDPPAGGFPFNNYDPDRSFHYNPEMLDWMERQFAAILGNPMLRALGANIYDNQRDVARSLVFSYACLEENGGTENLTEGFEQMLIEGSDYDFAADLLDMCEPYYDGSFDNYAWAGNNRTHLGLRFWLRRTLDGSADRVWSMLESGMRAYDEAWLDTRGMKHPHEYMRGGYEYLDVEGNSVYYRGDHDEYDEYDDYEDYDEYQYYEREAASPGFLSPSEILNILHCILDYGDNKRWLESVMYDGPMGCFTPDVPENRWDGPQALEGASEGISFYKDMPAEGFPYKYYYSELSFHYNPKGLEWLDRQFESILSNPKLRNLGIMAYEQQYHTARSLAFAKACLDEYGGPSGFLLEFEHSLVEGEEYDWSIGLIGLCKEFYDGSFDNFSETWSSRTHMALRFWLRRALDGSAEQVWALLEKGMQAYDGDWFVSKGLKRPGQAMRGIYEYLDENGAPYKDE